ncbi:aminopeptidase N [Frigidibacter sp. ROC022]|uniref:aminopeptidase N n=1 Tax=Frigidibacter sp. ROC022 TaxID=2971796 RepID=UPI00215ABD76|nr:aminopeptidase N [Frigidibacter sp. ROC022]MCR8725344.1 aminopeptidase N [Frigidibacter sp. ROC022]
MRDDSPTQTLLADYRPYPLTAESVALTFRLAPSATRVTSAIRYRANPAGSGPVRFDGEKLRLIRAAVDGVELTPGDYELDSTGLTLTRPLPDSFLWEAEVEIDPAANTALEGLYISKGMYCTQCEAEGFRKITFYPDRPDVMAPFKVRIESDLPVLLSNGNPVGSGPGWAEWDDPWPKPAYLFALVAGDLVATHGEFITCEDRRVDLNIWTRPGDEDKCDYALDSLIRSMDWDERVYGRAYDLDIFNIVAVDDFNMGAMENKGLNIFNSRYVLASPETATDKDYELIEGIIAHEYFHNWTGNRITCRDWFQLCLKEGLTVFRDQQFTGDMRSQPVKRIDDVLGLRAGQFREDSGPLSHPVRPDAYAEINNFYTATVYRKGAEVIGMLRRLVGPEGYDKALDLYFERHDGDAATIEDWLKVFEDATGRDLTQFKRWYTQSGTPRVSVEDSYADGTYTLTLRQQTLPTPGQPDKQPQVIPVAMGLLNPNGDEVLPTRVLELTEAEQTFEFKGLSSRPVPSLLRDFSAPVVLDRAVPSAERAFLLAHDTDPFNRWESGRALAKDSLLATIRDGAAPDADLIEGLRAVITDDSLDPAFRAKMLALPGEDDLAQTLHQSGTTPDPLAIHRAVGALEDALARALESELTALHDSCQVQGPYTPDAASAGKRALGNAALGLLTRLDPARARAQFSKADNMTQQQAAWAALLAVGEGAVETRAFYEQWQHERLVIDKWFSMQVTLASPETCAETARALQSHKDFDWKNPNRCRSVIGALALNAAGFHDPSGASYRLLADALIRLDPINPQTAARVSSAFDSWGRYDAHRQELIRAELRRVLATPDLSRDLTEMVSRILGA